MINILGDDIEVYRKKKFKDNSIFAIMKKRNQAKKKNGSSKYY